MTVPTFVRSTTPTSALAQTLPRSVSPTTFSPDSLHSKESELLSIRIAQRNDDNVPNWSNCFDSVGFQHHCLAFFFGVAFFECLGRSSACLFPAFNDCFDKSSTPRYFVPFSQFISTATRKMAAGQNAFDMQIKLLMIGDSGVGKTCLLLRYANDSFSPTFITTIGIDFKIKNIQLDGKRIKLQVCNRHRCEARCICLMSSDVMMCFFSARCQLDLGYGRPRTLQNDHDIILPRSAGHFVSL